LAENAAELLGGEGGNREDQESSQKGAKSKRPVLAKAGWRNPFHA
jgi:hypothetical protein